MLTYNEEGQGSLFAPESCCGKMSPEPSPQTKEKISGLSLKKQSVSQSRTLPTFHYLPKGGGRWLTPGMETDGPLPTAFSTHSFGECPSVVVESRLSQILEDTPPSKYFLSAKACAGILRRAMRRGKELPPELKSALEMQSQSEKEPDERGGGKGPLIQVERSGTLACNNDQTIFCLNDQDGQAMSVTVDATGTLRAQEHGHQPIVAFAQNQLGEIRTGEVAGTLNTNSNASGRNAPLIYDARGNGDGKIACTITGDHEGRITDYTAIVMAPGQGGTKILENTSPTLTCNREQPVVTLVKKADAKGCLTPWDVQSRRIYPDTGIWPALYAGECGGGGHGYVDTSNGILRRLTPLECERLQGYPDGWTDIGPWVDSAGKRHKESSDTARYKALGNSIALPPWAWVLKRLCACYERPATMASLFDGIGGFPLLWERLNGPRTCLWASEIEEFPMAVTKQRFGGNNETD